jgi:hypothetical protein
MCFAGNKHLTTAVNKGNEILLEQVLVGQYKHNTETSIDYDRLKINTARLKFHKFRSIT